jgi:hypothetical protein
VRRQWIRHSWGVLDLLAAVGLVIEQDIAAAAPHGGADGGESHVGGDDLEVLR